MDSITVPAICQRLVKKKTIEFAGKDVGFTKLSARVAEVGKIWLSIIKRLQCKRIGMRDFNLAGASESTREGNFQ
jgi:hypothetical protein